MPGFGSLNGDINSLFISHLADENDIRILPQRCTQSLSKAFRVGSAFTLSDAAFIISIEKLDRVFDCYDLAVFVLINQVDHGRQCGGLATAGYSRHEYNRKTSINSQDKKYGRSALIWAVCVPRFGGKTGYHEIVKLLLDAGADLKLKDRLGNTAINWAEKGGNKEIIKLVNKTKRI